jgi:uncharacterized protein (DUF58 family)
LEKRHWYAILIVLLVFGIFFKVPELIGFTTLLLILIGLADWWQRHSLDSVIYRRKPFYKRSFPGEEVALRLEIQNRKLLPITWLRVQDPWPTSVGPKEEEFLAPTHIPDQGLLTNIFSLRWYERISRDYTLMFRKRGIYAVGPAKLESGDLFGLFENSKEEGEIELLTVFPNLLDFSQLQLPAEDPFGDKRSRRRIFEDPNQPIGVRNYHPEDSFRRVHWPMTAHTGELQVKVYQPSSANVLVVCLNVSTFSRHWEGTNPALLEYLIKVTATLVNKGIQDGYRVGLIANGCLAHADQPFRIPPGRSPRQLATLLEALAGVTPVVTSPFETFLIKEIPHVPFGATLLLVTGIMKPEIGEALYELKNHGRRITLLSFSEQPSDPIQGVRMYHIPFRG